MGNLIKATTKFKRKGNKYTWDKCKYQELNTIEENKANKIRIEEERKVNNERTLKNYNMK